jgi:hypothetical protein
LNEQALQSPIDEAKKSNVSLRPEQVQAQTGTNCIVRRQAEFVRLCSTLLLRSGPLGQVDLNPDTAFRGQDPLVVAAAGALVVGMAMTAAFFPARRASRIDPLVALRHE